jgi:hypothetical protein
MEKKPILVEIEDLRDIVGGAGAVDVALTESSVSAPGLKVAQPSVNGTAMCWYGWAKKEQVVDDWTVIKGQ